MIVWAAALIVVLAGFFLWLAFSRPAESDPKPPRFVCDECGETHCNCHLEEDEPS